MFYGCVQISTALSRGMQKKVMSSQNWKSGKATSPFLSNHVERNHLNDENMSNKLYVSPHSACDHKNTTNDTNITYIALLRSCMYLGFHMMCAYSFDLVSFQRMLGMPNASY